MPSSSLASALAASKQRSIPAITPTPGINEVVEAPPSRPLSSLRQYHPKKEIGHGDCNFNQDRTKPKIQSLPLSRANNPPSNEDGGGALPVPPTTRKGKEQTRTEDANATTAPILSHPDETGEVVLTCDVPSDSDEDEDAYRDAAERTKLDQRKRRGTRKGKKRETLARTQPIVSNIKSPSEFVFVCDIPSDADDDGLGTCKEYTYGRRDRGRGGGGRNGSGSRWERKNQCRQSTNYSRGNHYSSKGGQGNNTSTVVLGGKDQLGSNTATQARIMKKDVTKISNEGVEEEICRGRDDRRYVGNSKTYRSMPTPWSVRVEEATRNGDNETVRKVRDNPTQGNSSSCVPIGTSNTTNPTPTNTDSQQLGTENEHAMAGPVKLKLTVLKGRWADEDSDSD